MKALFHPHIHKIHRQQHWIRTHRGRGPVHVRGGRKLNDRRVWLAPFCTISVVALLAVALPFAVADKADAATPGPLIVGNNAAYGGGPIQTYDFSTGALFNSFVPSGATNGTQNNGRAVAVVDNQVFYSELTNQFGPSDAIHIAPFNGGAGGADTGTLPNPAPTTGIQDLKYANGALYALTGYRVGPLLQVWKLNPANGAVLAGPIGINSTPSADGFAVLPDGNFLINAGDSSCNYSEYDSATGAPTVFSFTVPGASKCTGVDTDGTDLYFETDFSSFTETDLTGTLISRTTVASNNVEDISLVHSSTGSGLPSITITNVVPGNGHVQVYFTTSSPYTSYVITATPNANNRIPAPLATSVSTPPPGAPGSVTISPGTVGGLIEDCHQAYSISVTPMEGNVAGPVATWTTWVRPSGIVQASPAEPPYVVVLLDGIAESKAGLEFNPSNPTPQVPSYCPQAFEAPSGTFGVPSWLDANFYPAPNGPLQFFEKWNFYDPSDTNGGNDPATESNSTPRSLDGQETPTNEFMLDAVAAQGGVILPYSYTGATLKSPTDFSFTDYTVCNSTPPGVIPFTDCKNGDNNQSIRQDVNALNSEIVSINKVWPHSHIVVMGHSQGGLIAFDWFNQHAGSLQGVTNLFSLDSPINGVDTPKGTPLPGYPDFQSHVYYDTHLYLPLDRKLGFPFRFIGTWGDGIKIPVKIGPIDLGDTYAYGGPYSDETLQHQLLVTGPNCSINGITADCPRYPNGPDNVSGSLGASAPYPHNLDCSITISSPAWVRSTSHFVVKFCPENVAYFNGVLSLPY